MECVKLIFLPSASAPLRIPVFNLTFLKRHVTRLKELHDLSSRPKLSASSFLSFQRKIFRKRSSETSRAKTYYSFGGLINRTIFCKANLVFCIVEKNRCTVSGNKKWSDQPCKAMERSIGVYAVADLLTQRQQFTCKRL